MQDRSNPCGVSAIVLAAGSSTRMGTVKPLVRIGGETMLERTLSALRESRVDEIIVVLGHSADLIQRSVGFDGARIVINDSYYEGMASSLRTGLSSLRADAAGVLIVLADQPFLKHETIDRLIDEYRENKPEIIVPTYNGFRGNPVLLDRSVFDELAELKGDIGCRAIFQDHRGGILKLPVQDAGVLLDLDTPADVERFGKSSAEQKLESTLFEHSDLSGREADIPQLVIVGQDPVARALIKFARALGFRVVLIDPFVRAEEAQGATILRVLDFSRLAHQAETFVVVTSRGRFDEEAIEQALNMNALHVALLSNKKRAQELLSSLHGKGVPEEKLARVRAPAGLEIGAVTPAEIALSIMAEVVSKRRGILRN
jgi:molybdenum cofactor cytidylyltransferase